MQGQGFQTFYGSTEHMLALLTTRVELLEETTFKKKRRISATEAQKFLLLYHSGCVEKIIQNNTASQKGKDLLISTMLGIDPDNARKFLAEIAKKEKPLLHTESNYTFLVNFFKENGYADLEQQADKILLSILNRKGK